MFDLVEWGHVGWPDAPRRIATNIPPRLGVVRVVSLSGIQMGDPWLQIRDVAVGDDPEHSLCHIVAELLHLLSDVQKKSIA